MPRIPRLFATPGTSAEGGAERAEEVSGAGAVAVEMPTAALASMPLATIASRMQPFEESMEGVGSSELVVMAGGLGAGLTEAAAKGSGT